MARPLVKRTEEGDLYIRPHGIETKIDAALAQDWCSLTKRVRTNDRGSADFTPSECLVHLIRDALRRNDEPRATVLLPLLLARCEADLLRTVPNSRIRNAEAVREEILSDFMLMFTEDGMAGHEDELDYFECKFDHAFRTFRISRVRRELSLRKELVDLPQSTGEEGDETSDDEALSRLSRMVRADGAQEDRVHLRQVLKAVSALPDDQRKTVVLCRILGYEEESTDPSKRTAATICDVKGRTIRNHLSRASKVLKRFQEDL
jgi:hypothetical protein